MKRLLAFSAMTVALACGAEAATVMPHRAVYDLALSRVGNGSSLSSAQGRIAFEISGSACEGFSVSFRMATRYQPAEGEGNLIDTQSVTFEGPGMLEFRHQVKEIVNGETKDDVRIGVSRTAPGGEGTGTISGGEEKTFTIPASSVFPMQHQLLLMTLGEQGGGRDSSVVYDGSDRDKTFRAISFVGKAKPPGSIARDQANPEAAPLRNLTAWPMTISYFPGTGGEEMPDYQVSFDMYENGVATGVQLDYGAFALTGTLAKLDMLEAASCP